MTTTFRPMIEDERRQLAPRPQPSKWPLLLIFCAFFAVAGYEFGAQSLGSPLLGFLFAVLLPGGLGIGIHFLMNDPRQLPRQDQERRKAKDLERGEMEIRTYAATAALRVKEEEDEGSHYFLRLDDGTVLYLTGQYLYEYEEDKVFPATEFDIVLTPESKIVFELQCRGTRLEPEKTFKPFARQLYQSGSAPQDLEILATSWSELATKYSLVGARSGKRSKA